MGTLTVLRGRPPAEGGPYRVFRCLACGAENGVLAGPGGGRLLHPLWGLEPPSVLDRLLSSRERLRLDAARAWWVRNRGRVERFRRGLEPRFREAAPTAADGPADGARPGAGSRPAGRKPAASGPHAVLGVPADASPDEIRRAYLRLAKRLHPDRAGPGSAARFRAVRAAYEEIRPRRSR